MVIAALAAGIATGVICGVLIEMLRTRGDRENLEAQLADSIPKIKVVRAINRNKRVKGLRKERDSIKSWNGGIEAVWADLREDLR